MKKILLAFFLLLAVNAVKAQKIDSIFVHLYTDSLKAGTYNYINIDGLMSNGRYLPLDTNHIVLKSDYGTFYGNSLWVEKAFKKDKVHISVCLKDDPKSMHEFDMYIKKKEDGNLKTNEEILQEMRNDNKRTKRS